MELGDPMLSKARIVHQILRISTSGIFRRLHSVSLMVGTSSDERRCACISCNQPATCTGLQKEFRICSMNSHVKIVESKIQPSSQHNLESFLSHYSCLSMFRATPWTSVGLCCLFQNLFCMYQVQWTKPVLINGSTWSITHKRSYYYYPKCNAAGALLQASISFSWLVTCLQTDFVWKSKSWAPLPGSFWPRDGLLEFNNRFS